MPSPAYQHGPRNPNEISTVSKLNAVLPQDSPAASYATLMGDELFARGRPVNQANINRVLNQVVMAKAQNRLPTPRLQRIWAMLYTGVPG